MRSFGRSYQRAQRWERLKANSIAVGLECIKSKRAAPSRSRPSSKKQECEVLSWFDTLTRTVRTL